MTNRERAFKYIPSWWDKRHVCADCGEHRSVKYRLQSGETVCNVCALTHFTDKKESAK